MWPIVVLGIGTSHGCGLFKVIPPHLILVSLICVCIIIGSLDRVIDALRQVDWFHIKFKSIVGRLSIARFLFQSSKFGHHISVWQLWAQEVLVIAIYLNRHPAEHCSDQIWCGVVNKMILIPLSFLHVRETQAAAIVDCDMVLHGNWNVIYWA